MNCLLKRFLPFALTLIVGLMLWSLIGKPQHSIDIDVPKQTGFGVGNGSGYGPHPNEDLNNRTFSPRDVDRKAQVLSRPQPQYTNEARENWITGTVVLRVVFSSDGQVRNIRVISGLPDGLTEAAVEAARQIKFSPAIKDGEPVSQYIQIEYNFNLY